MAEEATSFFTGLFGLKVTAEVDPSVDVDAVGALATYVNDEGEVKGRILCDLQGAAILGAALTQIPMGRVEDAVKEGSLPENLQENLSEVFNISVNLLPGHVSQRLVLQNAGFNADCEGVDEAKAEGTALKLDVQRYGQCVLKIS